MMKKLASVILFIACILPTFLHINITVNNNIHINKEHKGQE